MVSMPTRLAPTVVGVAVAALGVGTVVATPAQAGSDAPAVQAVHRGALGPDKAAVITGYQQVSAAFTDQPQATSNGSVECPAGTVVVGGGVGIADTGPSENVNRTYPYAQKHKGKLEAYWIASVTNASSGAGTFTVYADCAKKPSKWTIVTGAYVVDRHGTQVTADVSCPSGLVVLGGGGLNDPSDTVENLGSTSPYQDEKGWYVNANNDSPSADSDATATAICAKQPAGYALVNGNPAEVGPYDQEGGGVECPSGTSVLGGGTVATSSAVTVDINTSQPESSNVWEAYEDDTAQDTTDVSADAICADT